MLKNYILILLFLFAFSCSDKESKLVQDTEDLVQGLDPSVNFGVAEKQVYSQIYETLVTLGDDWKTIIPKLAIKWDISENKLNYTFYLRKNVYFHNGNQLYAEDVKQSFIWQLKNDYYSQLSSIIKEIKIVDLYTIIIVLNKPYPVFLYDIASPSGILIISKQAIEKYNTQLSHHPVGTGPFKLLNWDSEKEIELNAFPKYWRKKSNIDKIKFVLYRDMSLLQEDLQDGKLDIIFQVPGHIIDLLKWKGNVDYLVQKPINLLYIGFNNSNKIMKNILLRKAILKSINLPQLVLNVNRGNAIMAKGPLPPVYFNYSVIEQDSYNISEAKKLMKEAGYNVGLKLNFCVPNHAFVRLTSIEFIKEYLSRIGITLNIIETNSWSEHNAVVLKDDIHLFFDGGEHRTLGDVLGFLYSLFHSNSSGNLTQYSNPRVDLWLDSSKNEHDQNEKKNIFNKIVKLILDDTPAVFMYHVKPHFAYNSKKIKKLPVNPYGIIQYHNVILNDNY